MSNMLKVDGTAVYAMVKKPDNKFHKYSIDLVVDEDTSKTLKSYGLRRRMHDGEPKEYEDFPGIVYTFRRKSVTKDGTPKEKPFVVDSQATPFDGLVGNGSKVRVYLRPYSYKSDAGEGKTAELVGVQIIDLVEYKASGESAGGVKIDVLEEGFTTSKKIDLDEDII